MQYGQLQESIFKKAGEVISKNGYKNFSLEHVSSELELPLSDVLKVIPTKEDYFRCFSNFITERLEAELSQADLLLCPPKDRILEIFLCRYEVLDEYMTSLKDIIFPPDLCTANKLPKMSCNIIAWVLSYAQIDAVGIPGEVLKGSLIAMYVAGFKKWCEDLSEGKTATQAFLDKYLLLGEQYMEKFK